MKKPSIRLKPIMHTGQSKPSFSYRDSDGDGVINKYDCKPFDPNQQGKLHDLAIKALEKKEEYFERRREAEMKKLSDESDRLNKKLAGQKAKSKLKNDILAKKQAIINEINNEKLQIIKLKEQNRKIKQEIYNNTTRKKVYDVVAGEKSKKLLKKTSKFIGRLLS